MGKQTRNIDLLVVFLVLAASMNICTTHGRKLLEDNLPSRNQVAIPIVCRGGRSNYATFGGGDEISSIYSADDGNIPIGNQLAIPILSRGGGLNNAGFYGGDDHKSSGDDKLFLLEFNLLFMY